MSKERGGVGRIERHCNKTENHIILLLVLQHRSIDEIKAKHQTCLECTFLQVSFLLPLFLWYYIWPWLQ
ncbi:hypothetical protein JHK85_008709 [Glycine max]|uniref:Uncharacterized protein n=2 Tax=Glycine subgen. Soja TaxID=1462606 RepID=K7KGY1_SOYBN|nr:hypothetical protein JHK87_008322 [Glycine soja]KAG5056199.1 hypothetical protein JHK85_008709 [Glycine max]KAG5073269.1 hypothetical protein JHK86_008480 [Glycine max]KAH1071726.1 hypothetical protein GYH30_008298 [Glycine max]RZC22390.1 hypothetical protein D0Y65_008171 [Glycine soja]